MEHLINVAIICDIQNNTPIGVISSNPVNGDIAYSSNNSMLEESLEILFDNNQFLPNNEDILDHNMVRKEMVSQNDSYYLIALNYSLPYPWRILGVTSTKGDIEEVTKEVFQSLQTKGGKINEK